MSDEALRVVDELAAALASARGAVAFTGAGISTESGIADFRSPGGVWSRYQPVPYDEFLASHEARRRFWAARREMYETLKTARPNAGHYALARLEALGRLRAVITQNIDELHQQAGSRRVLELHGTARKVACVSCEQTYPSEEIHRRVVAGDEAPTCDACGGWLKSGTVSFGQPLPMDVWRESDRLARECDLFLAIGSSLQVQPAASLPVVAKRHGARLAIVTASETPLDDFADYLIRRPIGETFERIMGRVGPSTTGVEPRT